MVNSKEELKRSGMKEECKKIDIELEEIDDEEDRRKETNRKIEEEKEVCEWMVYTIGSAKVAQLMEVWV